MWLERLKNVSLLFLVITIPFARLYNINSYAIALFVITVLCSAKKKNFKLSFSWLLILYYLLICFNVVFIDQTESYINITKNIPLILIPVVLFFVDFKKSTLIVFVYSIAIASLISLIYTYIKSKGYIFYFHNPTEIIDLQINYLSIFICFSLAILYNEILQTNIAKLQHYILIPFFFFILAILFNRTGIIISILITIYFVLIYFKKQGNIKFLVGFIVLFCLLMGYIFTRPIVAQKFKELVNQDFVDETNYSNGISSRLLSWQCSLENIKSAGFFGFGVDKSTMLLKDCYKSELSANSIQFINEYNSHNQFLQTIMNLGIIGFLLLISIYGCILYVGIKNKDPLLIFYFIILLIFGMTESFLIRQWGLVFFSFFTSYLFLKHTLKTNSNEFSN
ncbi:hypothetical protein GH721_11075 [Kriegella sp. EG-1]|nr:hypothetical protein [Flavobacteriaceae bacterium EG-1]